MRYEMTVKTEHGDKVTVQRIVCHGDEAVASERAVARAMGPRGADVAITVKAMDR